MIDSTYFWISIFGLAMGTLSIRGSFIFMSSRFKISKRLEKIFSYIPAAILPALIAPMVFYHNGAVDFLLGKERVVILIVSTIICYLSKSMLATIVFGLVSLYFLQMI